MRAVVTGGTGFIGWHLSGYLLEQGHEVLAVDRAPAPERSDIEHLRGDLNEADVQAAVVAFDPDVIFHMAALPGVGGAVSLERTVPVLDDNVAATVAMLEVAAQTGAKFIFASSGAVYSLPESRQTPDEAPFRSGYAIAKVCAEEYVRLFQQARGVEYTICRFSNVYGPQFKPKAVVGNFLSAVAEGRPAVINGTGRQRRDFVFVRDIIRHLERVAREPGSRTMDFCSGVHTSVEDLWQQVAALVESIDMPLPAVQRALDGPTGIQTPGGTPDPFLTWTALEDGLGATLAWFVSRPR